MPSKNGEISPLIADYGTGTNKLHYDVISCFNDSCPIIFAFFIVNRTDMNTYFTPPLWRYF